ncbi:MAG TPA: c-type cytochrome biogenesis protein CcsB [Micromonosporaceae bacterium]|nr:c-type cytochrome biogenesis protein CcsB [Micromonosporaceae bacterium]
MSALSDQLLVVATLAYLVAMMLHAAEYAFVEGVRGGRAAKQPARELVGAGAGAAAGASGGGQEPSSDPTTDTAAAGRPSRTGELAGRAAIVVTVLAAVANFGTMATRGIAAGRMPWGNMYEFLLTLTFVGIAAWLVVLARRPALRHLGLFVTLAMVLLLGVSGLVLYVPIVPLVPALQSYWFIVHVATAVISSGIFLFGAVPAALFLIRSGYDRGKRGFPYTLGYRLPEGALLERLAFRMHAFAFPIWTFSIIAGAVWAEAAWGRPWGWDPKETWAFISWVVYAGYLHARATPSVKRTIVAWIAVLGFLTMLMNLFGVNLFIGGLHSYAGVE